MMDAGREMDTLIAEKVMGFVWDARRCPVCGWAMFSTIGQGCIPGNCSMRPPPLYHASEPPHYSTDIAAAWQVVEHMRQQWAAGDSTSNFWTFKDCGNQPWQAQIELFPDHDAPVVEFQGEGDTLSLAICRAALAALGVPS